jgi:hypothetical protein
MQNTEIRWSNTPLFHAGINVINTPTVKLSAMDCWGPTPRLNVGNLHEIKRYWQLDNMPQQVK